MRRFSLLLVLAVLAVGCDSSGSDNDDDGPAGPFDAQAYVGDYTGAALVSVATPDTSYVAAAQAVTVSIAASGGSATINVTPEEGDPLTFAGSYDDDGAVLPLTDGGSTLVLRLDREGDVSGTGTVRLGTLRFRAEADGSISPTNLSVTLALVVSEGNEALPVGSRATVTLGARR